MTKEELTKEEKIKYILDKWVEWGVCETVTKVFQVVFLVVI